MAVLRYYLLAKLFSRLFLPFLQLNIAYPATGCQKLVEIDDEKKLRPFYEKRVSTEISAESLGDEWKVCT